MSDKVIHHYSVEPGENGPACMRDLISNIFDVLLRGENEYVYKFNGVEFVINPKRILNLPAIVQSGKKRVVLGWKDSK